MRVQLEGVYKRKKLFSSKNIIIIVSVISIILILFIFNIMKTENKENINKDNMSNGNTNLGIIENENTTQENNQDNNVPEVNLAEKRLNNIKGIYKSDTKIAYLTFDDGPSHDVTPLILDLLKEENIKATFFVLGSRVEKYPNVVKRAYEEGHYIANHGYSHKYTTIYQNSNKVLEEYNLTEELVRKAIGAEQYNSYLFRFPGGSSGGIHNDVKKQAITLLKEKGIANLDWNCLTRDSEAKYTKEQLLNNLKNTIRNQKSLVILSHDASGKILTYETLKDIINYLRQEGYVFGDIKNLMG